MPATQLKSVLIVSQGHPPLGRYLADAFKAQGIEAVVFSTDQNTWFDKWVIHPVNKQLHNLRILPKGKSVWTDHPWSHRNYLDSNFRKLYQRVQPDMILAIRGATYCDRSIKETDVIKFGWWVEPANRVHEIQSELPIFDWYYSMSQESLETFNAQGIFHCSYMPHMFSDTEFFPLEGIKQDVDVVFVGKHNPRRQRYIDAAMEVTSSVVLYGKDWLRKNWTNPRYWSIYKGSLINGRPLNKLYNRAKVVLNITQWEPHSDGHASGMNMRFFEVPATRSVFMSDAVRETESLLTNGKDFICFSSTEDFKKKLCELLNNPSVRQQISNSGYERIMTSKSSYATFIKDVIRRYDNLLIKNSEF